MASATNSLRLCLRGCRQSRSFRPAPRPTRLALSRALSTTRPRWSDAEQHAGTEAHGGKRGTVGFDKDYTNPGQVLRGLQNSETLTTEEKLRVEQALTSWEAVPSEQRVKVEKLLLEVRSGISPLRRPKKPKLGSFWNEREEDYDMITDEVSEEEFGEDDILSMGHGKLEEHREHRDYARLAVWELPLLSKFAKPFEPPGKNEPLRFRYTTYMGEMHPAERKVVVEFCPKDLPLTEAQQLKLKKLVGARYNPTKDVVRMSCELFDHQAQNKRYLGDLVQKLMAEAKDPTDMFENVPLDTRHHVTKTKPKFPKEWRMTDERRKELENGRREVFLLEQAKRTENKLIDGVDAIEKSFQGSGLQEKVAELATVRASSKPRSSRPGRR